MLNLKLKTKKQKIMHAIANLEDRIADLKEAEALGECSYADAIASTQQSIEFLRELIPAKKMIVAGFYEVQEVADTGDSSKTNILENSTIKHFNSPEKFLKELEKRIKDEQENQSPELPTYMIASFESAKEFVNSLSEEDKCFYLNTSTEEMREKYGCLAFLSSVTAKIIEE
ncbi:hypothetical protein CQA49_08990 [Helicobacter sp. MIT 00-7814]|uniref:hypothetical protein n=1 Tax=unclassified Helicobacter TaxID=2593540 RepID=UPI000E1E60B5|nr:MULTISPECIES: hypothetical protein [unclassified Helicobacter]RDU51964.1 hypothetical protein CQA49_08990 [Helicobacter sp. MIT 00-7814]RDU54134.1 hypothetical protein CQA37_05845 [Helicobacter sp. MIT 99-10781]